MTLFEMIKTRPYEMQQEFSCGVRKQNENEVLVSVWRPKAKKCQLAVIAEGKRKLFPMYPAKMCGMEDSEKVKNMKEEKAGTLIHEFLEGMQQLGFTKTDVIRILKKKEESGE